MHFDTRLKIYGSTIGVRNLVCYVPIRPKFPDSNFAAPQGRPKAKCSAWLEVLKSYDAWATRRLPKAKLRTNQTDGQTDRQIQTSQSIKPTNQSISSSCSLRSSSNRRLVISELHFDTRLKIYGSTIGVRNLVCYVPIRQTDRQTDKLADREADLWSMATLTSSH